MTTSTPYNQTGQTYGALSNPVQHLALELSESGEYRRNLEAIYFEQNHSYFSEIKELRPVAVNSANTIFQPRICVARLKYPVRIALSESVVCEPDVGLNITSYVEH